MANFGPIDTSVLYGQANHRSEDVLGDPDTTLTVRRGDISFFRVLQLVPRHIRVLQVLQNMGFLGILQCGHIEIDTHLITALVERWRPETHTFHFSVGEATITLQDISIIWALPIEGVGSTDITGYRPTDTRDWEYVYNRMEQLVLDCDNSGDDIQSLRETRARNRAIGLDIMTFSSARYPSVRRGPASDDAGPSNVYNEVHQMCTMRRVHQMCTMRRVHQMYNEAGPSNFFTPTGPSYAYTSNMPFSSGDFAHNIHPETRRHLGISPVPFDGSDVNTP
ncbi:UNVERIFIED_CONTAM: Serine/threonine-protein phosphatase 7 long form [Sesamum calycinum]|uniref:Serine/threonine-protein phosphatase 7 long form n=1 Tax=Sesamum calycinum TaxID=2727403 RepID=A0AAW2SEI5_9LAMI